MLEKVFSQIENENHFYERNVLKVFQVLVPQYKDHKVPMELNAEIMAFSFMENNQNQSNWGTYFGSSSRFTLEDGSEIENPSFQDITCDVVTYWRKRINQTSNPVLKARYSGLVWDFTEKVCAEKAKYDVATTYVENLLVIVEQRIQDGISHIRKLKRSLSVAISLNNTQFINDTKDQMFKLEDEIGENKKPGLWGFCFDYLVDNKKINLTTQEESAIIDKLELRLTELTSGDDFSTWGSECVINRLAKYYHKKNLIDEARRVITKHAEAVEEEMQDMLSVQRIHYLEKLYDFFTQYGMRVQASEVLKRIKADSKNTLSEMKLFEVDSKVSKEDIGSVIEPITQGTKPQVFDRIVQLFIPRLKSIDNSLKEHRKEFLFMSMLNNSIVDEYGINVAKVGSLEEDLEGNRIHEIGQHMSFDFYLSLIFQKLFNDLNYTTEDFTLLINDSAIIAQERMEIIKKGIEAFVTGDYVICQHLIIPQIEEAIRNLIEINGGVVLELSTSGGYKRKTLNALLRDEIIIASLGEDIQRYFMSLFSDSKGWNLRNKISHGLMNPSSFSMGNTSRVIHALLIIGAIRAKKK